ncbi:hypothetical protein J8F10_03520 [Gemmata sp. G18]|uniref:Uncharacterized protein n=1 Tax=Gemmata palustris TaxID=2822762 RepID=A0ABS5BKY5_9BACT|nr:hypothetical protein [Gemmata palustris]MBP3954366.1 hypothetical protein [Gemmata palustris]
MGMIRLSYGGAAPLTADQWVEGVVKGYVEANALEDMVEQLPAYRVEAEKCGGQLLEVVKHLARRGGDLDALRVVLGMKSEA